MNYQENGYYEEPGNETMDAATFAAILRGDYGPEAQAEALEAANLQHETPEGGYQDPAQLAWVQDFIGQSHQLETRLQRDLPARRSNPRRRPAGLSVPRSPGRLEPGARPKRRNPEDRRAIAAEVYDETNELHEAEEQLEAEGRESANLNVQGAVQAE